MTFLQSNSDTNDSNNEQKDTEIEPKAAYDSKPSTVKLTGTNSCYIGQENPYKNVSSLAFIISKNYHNKFILNTNNNKTYH